MKRAVVSLAILVEIAFASTAWGGETYFTVLPYAGVGLYEGKNPKKGSAMTGAYLSVANTSHLFEFSGEYSTLEYNKDIPVPAAQNGPTKSAAQTAAPQGPKPAQPGGGGQPAPTAPSAPKQVLLSPDPVNQADITMAYTYNNYSWALVRAGLHHIESSETGSKAVNTLIAGMKIYQGYSWRLGVDGYLSEYQGDSKKVVATQYSPTAGFTLGDYFSYGSFDFQLTGNIIALDNDPGVGKTNFFSMEGAFIYARAFGALKLHAWQGDQVYAVRSGGFVVYNLAEIRKEGAGVSLKVNISQSSAIEASVGREMYVTQYRNETVYNWNGIAKLFISF